MNYRLTHPSGEPCGFVEIFDATLFEEHPDSLCITPTVIKLPGQPTKLHSFSLNVIPAVPGRGGHMRKYKIVYTQESGKPERTIECEFMTMPTNSDLTITFWQLMDMPQQPEPILVINPNEIAEIERVRDTKVENVFQSGAPHAEDPLSAAAFGLDDEAEHHEPHGPVGNPTHGPDGDVLKGE